MGTSTETRSPNGHPDHPKAVRNRRHPRRGRHLPDRRAGDLAGPRRHRLAGGRTPAGADRPRHPRVGADAGGGAGRRRRRGRRRRAARRRPADPGGGDPGEAARARPRGGRLRLPQPLPGQRDQVLQRPGHQARRRDRGADRGADGGGAAGDPAGRRRARAERRPRGLSARPRARLPARPLRPPHRPRLRQRRHLPCRPGDLRAARCPGRDDRGRARRAQHQRRLRLDPHGGADRQGRRVRGRPRLRLRRRRRPRARGRRPAVASTTATS